MKSRAILFDLDGTLIDHDSAARAAVLSWSEEIGVEADVERWIELDKWGFARFERGETTIPGQRRDRIRAYTGQKLDDAACDRIFSGYLRAYEANWRAFGDAHRALKRAVITGRPVGILTNGAEELQRRKLLRTGLDLPGVTLLAATTLDSAKPRPEMYERALATLDATTATIIGDDWSNDVATPRSLGWTAWYLDRSGHDDRADVISLDELDFLRTPDGQ
ncbi:HAD family hydrolase [Corynebacterium pacaense]|uniref:HAD family hydrolase n=1 Tax=Corynebacterium pacaense TaxID=1816684 RepID=UPI0009B9FADC|nr:HAD family hydrolase [Corynebacterium pacaense]